MHDIKQKQISHLSSNLQKHLLLCLVLILLPPSTYPLNLQSTQTQNVIQGYSSQFNNAILSIISSEYSPETRAINIFKQLYKFRLSATWTKTEQTTNQFLSAKQGRAFLSVNQQYIQLSIYNGDYADKGIIKLFIENRSFKAKAQIKDDEHLLTIQFNQSIYSPSLSNSSLYPTNPTLYKFYTQKKYLHFQIDINVSPNFSLSIVANNQQKPRINDYTFALMILFIISVCQYLGIKTIFCNIKEGFDRIQNYSFLVFNITALYDYTLWLYCLVIAIQIIQYGHYDIKHFILIAGAIISGIIFIIVFFIQWFLIFKMYKRMKCAQIAYGVFLICQYLLGSHCSQLPSSKILFIFTSMLFLPQILVNGRIGIKPHIFSSYYIKFLSLRLLIWYYFRGYSSNTQDIETDYLLCMLSLILVFIQFGLLYIQKIKGPRRVIPSFLLPTIFIYEYKIENINFSEEDRKDNECIICLNEIQQQPPKNLQVQVKYQVVRTPCNHIYHGFCLQVWMKQKMECPICKSKLPPIL